MQCIYLFPNSGDKIVISTSNSFKYNSNSNILHCLQHVIVIVIERKLSNNNILHCNVNDARLLRLICVITEHNTSITDAEFCCDGAATDVDESVHGRLSTFPPSQCDRKHDHYTIEVGT